MRYEITVDLDDAEDAKLAYAAIERLIHGMGEIGTVSMLAIPSSTDSQE